MDFQDGFDRAQAQTDPAARVRALTALLADVGAAEATARAARDRAVRDLHSTGVRVAAIQAALGGVSRGRVHQIIRGSRV